ncbi:hypothetical protein WS105_0663 [Weissella ceti]|uniref:hypothetical protein n=1 Tax=Weissella ceti TaxID=759620 RepID=UPI0004F5C783|nr:hypothetical protein [Weissella ceti]AIM64253.1 hypothetical protein WS105_0663 [Weissella ceti]
MGFKEYIRAKTEQEYKDAKKDPALMEELRNRSMKEVLSNAGSALKGGTTTVAKHLEKPLLVLGKH